LTIVSPFGPSSFSVAAQRRSGPLRVGILSTFPPTLCGLAMFSTALADGLTAAGADVSIVRVSDGSPSESDRVVGELVNGSRASIAACAELLNQYDVAVVQHAEDVYGGAYGDEVVDILGGLRVPSIVIVRRIPKNPTHQQRSVLEAIVVLADQVVVMSQAANQRLCSGYNVDRHKVVTIPHGATVPIDIGRARCGRPTLVTWGFLGPGKGIERVIDAMPALRGLPGRPRYLIAGRTHPKVLAQDGEAYREALMEQVERLGVADSVVFDPGYRNTAMLTALAQSAAVIVVPYDSTDQVTSGVLVDAIAAGRPVVATAFPHAVELLANGAGLVVAQDDPDALVSTLRRVLTQPCLAGDMAAAARQMAPEMAWSVVADAYLELAHRTIGTRRRAPV
jgi:polysaccharide biosynthesis protein PslF